MQVDSFFCLPKTQLSAHGSSDFPWIFACGGNVATAWNVLLKKHNELNTRLLSKSVLPGIDYTLSDNECCTPSKSLNSGIELETIRCSNQSLLYSISSILSFNIDSDFIRFYSEKEILKYLKMHVWRSYVLNLATELLGSVITVLPSETCFANLKLLIWRISVKKKRLDWPEFWNKILVYTSTLDLRTGLGMFVYPILAVILKLAHALY